MPESFLTASIIPDRKTPRGVDVFTYAIPLELTEQITPGKTVVIPFRSQSITGVVRSIQAADGQRKKIKPITTIHSEQLWSRSDRMEFLEWFAKTYCVSLATALHTLCRSYTKTAVFSELASTNGVKQIPEIVLYNTLQSHDNFIKKTIQDAPSTCVIIEPEIHQAQHLVRLLDHAKIPYINLFGTTSKKSWTKAQDAALGNDTGNVRVIIGSRTALFLAFNDQVTIIIDHEHEKSHKQYDMNPRYRAGTIADFLFHQPQSGVTHLIIVSPTPTTFSWLQLKTKNYTLRDIREQSAPPPQIVDMNHYTNEIRWLSDQALQQIQRSNQSLLFLNRIGLNAYTICTDCGKAGKEMDAYCSFCQSVKLKTVKKGIKQLEQEIKKAFPNKSVLRIDSSIDQDPTALDAKIAKADIIVGTEKVLRTTTISQVDSIIVLSVDHLLIYPHYQSQERVFQLLLELHYAGKQLLIQTHAAHHPVWNFVKNTDVTGFLDSELTIRTMLKQPPARPLWIARQPKTHVIKRLHNLSEVNALPSDWLIDFIDD